MITLVVWLQNKSCKNFNANIRHVNYKFVLYCTRGKRSQSALEYSLPRSLFQRSGAIYLFQDAYHMAKEAPALLWVISLIVPSTLIQVHMDGLGVPTMHCWTSWGSQPTFDKNPWGDLDRNQEQWAFQSCITSWWGDLHIIFIIYIPNPLWYACWCA